MLTMVYISILSIFIKQMESIILCAYFFCFLNILLNNYKTYYDCIAIALTFKTMHILKHKYQSILLYYR